MTDRDAGDGPTVADDPLDGGPSGDGPSGDGPSGDGPIDDGPVDDDYVDELPEDLQPTEFVGPYTFPNNNRRRIPAAIYLGIGVICLLVFATTDADSALVNAGTLWAGVGLVLFGCYGLVAGWTLAVEESDALTVAAAKVGFPVGHASAQMVWRGWLSRPTWRILCYSAEDPPRQRAIVVVDGVSGAVVEWFAEENPEDWSSMDGSLTA